MELTNAGALESTLTLLARVREGDQGALDVLIQRYRPRLVRWARGRLPPQTRDLTETQDIVQETLLQAFRKVATLEVRGEGALQAYLRQALMNRIRMEIRRASRKPAGDALTEELVSAAASPLDESIGRATLDRYERALASLSASDREIVIAHVEFGFSHTELAAMFQKSSANTARMALRRALLRLAQLMGHQR